MNSQKRFAAEYLLRESRRFSYRLERVPSAAWPPMPSLAEDARPSEVWRSRAFLVMVYHQDGYERLSVLRTEPALNGRFAEGITWDDLQRLKAECGRGDRWAVEVFPPDAELVNIQNMRHLFLLQEAPPYAWRSAKQVENIPPGITNEERSHERGTATS